MNRRWVVLVLVAIACGRNSDTRADSAGATAMSVAPAPSAAVTILTPAEGDTVGPDVVVTLGASGVTIQAASGARAEGIGHHHLFLDTLATAEGDTIPPTNARVVHIGTGDSTYTFKGLSPGPHEIIAVIGFGDHAAMGARRDTVRFFVRR